MAIHKNCLMSSLLFLGAVALMVSLGDVKAAGACPLYCLQVEYMTCPSSGNDKLPPKCNCCLAPKGCTLHLSDGTSRYCSR